MFPKTINFACFIFTCSIVGSSICFSTDEGLNKTVSLSRQLFRIKVIDEQTGRGVPLIKLETTNRISYVTDSHGVIAFYEPGLMDKTVFFHISGHGYEYPEDGFGFRGKRIEIKPGGSTTIKVKRINIAERLYRVTGQGIYRDSVMLGEPVPLENPVINGLVMGQDSVQNCWYKNKLYWFWGDTTRPSYPLGHFATAGAVSDLPGRGGLDPSAGVELHYFTDADGFSKKMAPMSEPGMIWLDGILVVRDTTGRQHMLAKYARMKSLGKAYEKGLMHFNDETEQFEPIIRDGTNFLLNINSGHPFGVEVGKDSFYYFASPFPLAVKMRVKASWESAIDPNQYEVFTSLTWPDGNNNNSENEYRWISIGDLTAKWGSKKSELIESLSRERNAHTFLYDIETSDSIKPHGGSVYWNRYRKKWIMITVQDGGKSSYLGEVWYAEADTPVGPWAYARKIVTHNSYSFYNPKQHPYFDRENGCLIYFEGTYSYTFSGRPESATPRYDYNQIMYRLDLSDRRLCLPAPVYEAKLDSGNVRYLLANEIRSMPDDSISKNVSFYAIAPDRAWEGLVPVYAERTAENKWHLTIGRVSNGAEPLFFALKDKTNLNDTDKNIVRLYEYRNKKSGNIHYSVDSIDGDLWERQHSPLCYVWKNPASVVLTDWTAECWNNWEEAD